MPKALPERDAPTAGSSATGDRTCPPPAAIECGHLSKQARPKLGEPEPQSATRSQQAGVTQRHRRPDQAWHAIRPERSEHAYRRDGIRQQGCRRQGIRPAAGKPPRGNPADAQLAQDGLNIRRTAGDHPARQGVDPP